MGKRYYCEFCDKSFADNRTNRKNHLNGLNHQRLKKQHYDAFRGKARLFYTFFSALEF
jgi:U11/U12 small nuclear ribonucleoprotein SNRNP20